MTTFEKIPILDHGYLQLVETWGSDERIVEAARMSTGKGFQGWGVEEKCINCKDSGREPNFGPNHNCRTCGDFGGKGRCINKPGDEKLLKYLMDNHHDTPFEMAGMVIEVQAPIVVFREWHRHRTQSYNEMSARYAPLPDVNYVPTAERCLIGGGHLTKQAGTIVGAEALTTENAKHFRDALEEFYADAESLYQAALNKGIPKELARLCLPVGRYSRMRASANLRNWLAFLTLRSDHVPSGKFAQWEIRQYANGVGDLIAQVFPRTFKLFIGRAA